MLFSALTYGMGQRDNKAFSKFLHNAKKFSPALQGVKKKALAIKHRKKILNAHRISNKSVVRRENKQYRRKSIISKK